MKTLSAFSQQKIAKEIAKYIVKKIFISKDESKGKYEYIKKVILENEELDINISNSEDMQIVEYMIRDIDMLISIYR